MKLPNMFCRNWIQNCWVMSLIIEEHEVHLQRNIISTFTWIGLNDKFWTGLFLVSLAMWVCERYGVTYFTIVILNGSQAKFIAWDMTHCVFYRSGQACGNYSAVVIWRDAWSTSHVFVLPCFVIAFTINRFIENSLRSNFLLPNKG